METRDTPPLRGVESPVATKKSRRKIRSEVLPDENVNDFLLPREVAAMLRTSVGVLAVWRSTGRVGLPYLRLGSKILYRRSDVDRFLRANEVGR
jgi:Helix-turn-helix domain